MTNQFVVQGRLVWGHPGKLTNKKDKNKQNVLKDGQPVMQCAFGLAIERNHFYAQVLPLLQAEARTAFPNSQSVQPSPQFPGGLQGVPTSFSWKFKDGEGFDNMGKPYNTREGYAGQCVLTIATQGFAPPMYKYENNVARQIAPEEVKCGDFAAVNITVKFNGASGTNTPGLYINPNGVVHLGYGKEIVSSAQDPDEMFAGFQPQQFAGMTTTPTMNTAPLPAGMQTAPQVGYNPAPVQQQPQYAPAPQQQPGYMPPPAHDFVQTATGQPPQQPVQYQPQVGYNTPPAHGTPGAPPYNPNVAPQGYTPQPAPQPQYAPAPQAQGYPGAPVGR